MISLAMPNCRRAFHGDGARKSLFVVRFSLFSVMRRVGSETEWIDRESGRCLLRRGHGDGAPIYEI
jgi:hypothetical protein